MEIRYATPYVSGLRWVLNPLTANVPVQDAAGNQTMRPERLEPSLVVEVTPYIGTIQGKTKAYEFKAEPTDLPSVDDVLSAAGVDVAAAWAAALDTMAETFPLLKDPNPGDEANGPAYYLRLDSWMANLQWEGAKSVTAVIGIYDDVEYSEAQAYVSLVFADGDTLRQRATQKANLQAEITAANQILAEPPTYPGWSGLTAEQKADLTARAPQQRLYAQAEYDRMNAQLVAPLSTLLSDPAVLQSVGALVAATFATLKATTPEWADVDVATIMSKFTLPSVE